MSNDIYIVTVYDVKSADKVRERLASCEGFVMCAQQPDAIEDASTLVVRLFWWDTRRSRLRMSLRSS